MRTSALLSGTLCAITIVAFPLPQETILSLPIPDAPNAGATTSPLEPETSTYLIGDSTFEEWVRSPEEYPARLVIPAIRLNALVQEVGLTAGGAMDVPNGRSKNVGWYAPGTIPGEIGSAVMDAHVYAAFGKLRYALPGTDVYIVTNEGKKLHFRIADSRLYEKDEVPLERLFTDGSGRYLNLITCAGKFIPSEGTYTHRLVAYAILLEE